MKYKVFYDLDCNEGWYFEIFDNFTEAFEFAKTKVESEIIGYDKVFSISSNIKLLY